MEVIIFSKSLLGEIYLNIFNVNGSITFTFKISINFFIILVIVVNIPFKKFSTLVQK